MAGSLSNMRQQSIRLGVVVASYGGDIRIRILEVLRVNRIALQQ
jgi:hypothetical protein